MEEIQESEVVCLVFGVVAILFLLRQRDLPRIPLIYLGIVLIVASQFFTVAEGLFWGEAMHLLEHLSAALAGIFFAAGIWRLGRTSRSEG